MADAEVGTEQPSSSGGAIRPDFSFIRSPPGLLLCINMVLLFLSWCIMAGWRNDVNIDLFSGSYNSKTSFFLFTTVFPWLLFIILFVILILGINKRLTMINWPLTMALNCIIWAVLLLIASSLVADLNCGGPLKCDTLKAAAAFGFFSMIGLVIQAILNFMEFRSQ